MVSLIMCIVIHGRGVEQQKLILIGLVVAMSVNCATAFMAIMMATLLKIMLTRLNKKLDRGEIVEGAVVAGQGEGGGEAESKGFRFLT